MITRLMMYLKVDHFSVSLFTTRLPDCSISKYFIKEHLINVFMVVAGYKVDFINPILDDL
jgi:hypothetical protein